MNRSLSAAHSIYKSLIRHLIFIGLPYIMNTEEKKRSQENDTAQYLLKGQN